MESAISQVGQGAGNPNVDVGSSAEMPHKGKITLSMREYKYRNNLDSEVLRQEIQEKLGDYPGVLISVEKDAVGPPAGSPINIELEGKDYTELIETAKRMREFINGKNISGIDKLKIDVNKDKPGMMVEIDRQKAGELGVSAAQIGMQLRNAVFGTKAGIYKENGENYDIYIRFDKDSRYDVDALFNQKITFRNNKGQQFIIPVSSLVKRKNQSGFNAIKHKETKRVVTVYSGLAPGFTDASAVVREIRAEMKDFKGLAEDITIDYTGQIEEQNKEMSFLIGALFAALGLIFFILIFQFNSISKPAIIMLAIFLSFIGVFGGLIITGAPFVIMMTMMGIISLAGVVVNNGVVLLDYTQLLIDRKKAENGLEKTDFLPYEELIAIIMKAGKSRLRPVLLTAITTILGLVPLSTGFNINFFTFLADFDPKIYVGGDNVVFWGPLANTVIYGLLVATFLTLIVVPVLFLLVMKFKMWMKLKKKPQPNLK